jgi:hypothetical protein
VSKGCFRDEETLLAITLDRLNRGWFDEDCFFAGFFLRQRTKCKPMQIGWLSRTMDRLAPRQCERVLDQMKSANG